MKYIKSNPNENAGVGHQWMNWSTGLVLARLLNCGFVHTPLISKRSGGNWDNFLNFGEDYTTMGQLDLPVRDLPSLDIGMDVSPKKGCENLRTIIRKVINGPDDHIYSLEYNTFLGVLGKDVWLILDELREKYERVNSISPNDRFTASFHLRRGDVNPEENPGRWEPNHFYIDWIRQIRKVLVERGGFEHPKIILFSTTGQTGEFGDFPDYVDLRIDGDPYEDFHAMVESDILFTGLSSYSILAAVLNQNFCFYNPLQTYCDWMENPKNPYFKNYSSVKNISLDKLIKWLDEHR